jgi:hypothetical protein
LKAIFASKLYKAQSADAKKHIRAALTDPMNAELVTQLKSYLDEEYQAIAEPVEPEVVETPNEEVSEEIVEEEPRDFGGNSPVRPSGGKSFSGRVSDIEDTLGDLPMGDGSDVEQVAEETTEDTEEVEEATEVSKIPITASFNLKNVVEELKGALNLDDATHGVALVKYDDRELWIYYQDDVNLNNIMYNVIEKINASGYSNLEFNRLARSDNAIVFDICAISTDDVVKPIENEE